MIIRNYIRGVRPPRGPYKKSDGDFVEPRVMTDGVLKINLCDCGPGYCKECGICAYGREWERRNKQNDGTI